VVVVLGKINSRRKRSTRGLGQQTRTVLEKDGTVNRPWVGSLGRMGRTNFQKAARKGGGREGNIRWKIRRGEEGWAR
jgi:hypothetical protein